MNAASRQASVATWLVLLVAVPGIGYDVNATDDVEMVQSAKPEPGWLPGLFSLLPGTLVRGSGLWMAGDTEGAQRLLIAEGIGLGMLGAGALPILLTDANGDMTGASMALALTGAGIYLLSGMADLYGAALGGRPNARPPTRLPFLESFFGYSFIHEPQFAYAHFANLRLDGRLDRYRLTGESWLAMDADNQLFRGEAAVRLAGPQARKGYPARDGSFVDIQVGLVYHRFGNDRFSMLTTELLLPSRLDLVHISSSLAGAFVELDLGWALQFLDLDDTRPGVAADTSGMLLLRFGFGLYFGGPDSPRGEVQLYYEHRRDEFAGGLALSGHETTFLGHFGLVGQAHFGRGWGLRLGVEVGSAWVTHLGVVFSLGGQP